MNEDPRRCTNITYGCIVDTTCLRTLESYNVPMMASCRDIPHSLAFGGLAAPNPIQPGCDTLVSPMSTP